MTITAKKLYEAGLNTHSDKLKSLFDQLLETDKTGEWICYAGREWSWFNYKEAISKLLEIDKTGEWLCFVLDKWPTGIFYSLIDAIIIMDRIIEIDKTGEWICRAGFCREASDFNYDKGFEKLLRIDKTGEWIFEAGCHWKKFDYKRAFNRLLNVDKIGKWIYFAGVEWKWFDHKRAADVLIDVDTTGYWIYIAGVAWKWFDYDKGLDKLLSINPRSILVYDAAEEWKTFDFEKLVRYLADHGLLAELVPTLVSLHGVRNIDNANLLFNELMRTTDNKKVIAHCLLSILYNWGLNNHEREILTEKLLNLDYIDDDVRNWIRTAAYHRLRIKPTSADVVDILLD